MKNIQHKIWFINYFFRTEILHKNNYDNSVLRNIKLKLGRDNIETDLLSDQFWIRIAKKLIYENKSV